ncbi:MAG: DNA polymerase III subunit alpha [Parvularculaceae bacterium]|nr:DNA polymerase III subunit alpha [Parvularculaceae bacterium]
MTAFAELCLTTNFSFLRGAAHAEEFAVEAKAFGLAGIGVADRNTLAGVVRAHAAAREAGLRLAAGARLVFRDGTPDILVYPTDRTAYGRLTKLLTIGNRRAPKGECWLDLDDFLVHAEGQQAIIAPEIAPGAAPDERLRETVRRVAARCGKVWLAARFCFDGEDRRRLALLNALAQETSARLLATAEPLFHKPERRPLADVLTCIREKTTLDAAGRRLAANAERCLKPPQEMARLYRDAPEAVEETARFLESVRFSLDDLRYNYPDETVTGYTDAQAALEDLTWKGAAKRYPDGVPEKVRSSLTRELQIIADLKYAAYFLTVADIVRYAREERNILCQGRGSAANSSVCYCLGVTSVDPARFTLLFDRFVSSERNEPPDIDIDFEHERREEAIQYVYEKYGRHRAALAATLICYRGRSAIRDVAKAFGFSEDRIAALSKTQHWWSKAVTADELRRLGLDPADPRLAMCLKLAGELRGFPRHLSQHVGGFVITRDRLDEIVPVQNAAMEDRTVIEWNKDDLDELRILKVDLLGLGMLTCLRKAFEMVDRFYPGWAEEGRCDSSFVTRAKGRAPQDEGTCSLHPEERPSSGRVTKDESRRAEFTGFPQAGEGQNIPLTIDTLPKEDPRVYAMLKRADTIGVFQVESRAQMSMLPRLRPEKFYDLVIEVAIVRPGPIQGGMVHPYLKRKQGFETVTYPSKALEAVLERTLGVPLFQEQAMQIAIVAAGFSPPEADKLRRAMATFRRVGTIGQLKTKFIDGMIANGYTPDFAESCFRQIEGFGEYGFPESHAASFALLVYGSSWIKCHYPDVFAAALLNAQPMGFYAPGEIVRDAQEHGVETRPPDINRSDWDNTLEQGAPAADRLHARHADMRGDVRSARALRLGFRQIDGLKENELRAAIAARGGGFDSLRDVWLRGGLSPASIERLASADAFRSLGLDRREALWAARALNRVGGEEDLPLFERAAMASREADVDLPALRLGEHVVEDYRTLRLSLKAHPAALVRDDLLGLGVIEADRLSTLRNGANVRTAGLVLVRQRPDTASGVIFMTLQDETNIANIIVWPAVFERFRAEVLGARLCAVDGKIQNEHGIVHVIAERLLDFSPLLARLSGARLREAVAPADEVRRPAGDARSHPRKVRHTLVPADVMPKGRNFH